MSLPIEFPLQPMLAKAARSIPVGECSYEPKWDGFRCLAVNDGGVVRLASRSGKDLAVYFPELVAIMAEQLPAGVVLDGELVVRAGESGAERLDWDSLTARIHPAASRIERLAAETPAEFIAFDQLTDPGVSLLPEPFSARRARLEATLEGVGASSSIHLTRTTDDAAQAADWFARFEGAGLDGVIAKPACGAYLPGKRTMIKIKHARTAEAVLVGYRVHKSGAGVGSLLLGLYDDAGDLIGVGGISAFTAARRLELQEELEPLVEREAGGEVRHAERERTRFSSARDTSFVPLRPERVVEVAFDQLEGNRFRHTVTFLRWRPDRDPESCRLEQIERAPAYDLARVLR
ncbi:ATP-dependent DNA ligase [Pseudactinotalea sp. HY160]|uniref:ATP-dependent DNA ligase n=1 Tax=Pseudactinotalea sp. HY160 TaxID=2654490 RepID=UPI00128D0CCA|nr:ATP-dependent DNA ligase [Pseudactinotalea sp. HY160]MPV51189.1 ATP-dependent DNA ligase [Pseudactinotalea sp. HY160]